MLQAPQATAGCFLSDREVNNGYLPPIVRVGGPSVCPAEGIHIQSIWGNPAGGTHNVGPTSNPSGGNHIQSSWGDPPPIHLGESSLGDPHSIQLRGIHLQSSWGDPHSIHLGEFTSNPVGGNQPPIQLGDPHPKSGFPGFAMCELSFCTHSCSASVLIFNNNKILSHGIFLSTYF